MLRSHRIDIYVTAAGNITVRLKVSRDSSWPGITIHAWWVCKTPSLGIAHSWTIMADGSFGGTGQRTAFPAMRGLIKGP